MRTALGRLAQEFDKSNESMLHASADDRRLTFSGDNPMNLPGLPGISGMVKVESAPNEFLVIHDTKGPLRARPGAISIEKEGPKYQELGIYNWPTYEDLPNDLEGICSIPGRSGEYLIVESGFYHGHFGRIIKIRFPMGIPDTAEYFGSFRPFSASPDKPDTPRPEQIEGIAVVVHNSISILLLALRGGKEKEDGKVVPGQLIWGLSAKLKPQIQHLKKKVATT